MRNRTGRPAGSSVGGVATDVRAAQRAATRRRIVVAVNDLLAEEHPAALSVPAVARRSGVSIPTIYRYFPTKEALLDAAAAGVDIETRTTQGDEPIVLGRNLSTFMHRMWQELAGNLPALRASQLPGVGRELRRRRSARRQEDATRALATHGVDLATEDGQRALRITLVLTSSSTLLEQLDRLDLPVDQAADDVVWAIETLADAVREKQQAGGSAPPA